jgi:hypothetical protein
MWAEMATNYYLNSISPSYYQKIFATDSGYIPALPRLISLFGAYIGLPAKTIPYFYTWISIISTGVLIGIFNLRIFRSIIKSDALRFITCIAIYLVADFETRTFINFSYFAVFFITILSLLAIKQDIQVPKWAWIIPILSISKPIIIATIPSMIIASIYNKGRFRNITIISLIFWIIQSWVLISNKYNTFIQKEQLPIISKIAATFEYTFGFLGAYIMGPNFYIPKYPSILIGIIIFLILIYLSIKKLADYWIIIFGICLIFFNFLVNCFTLYDSWNLDFGWLSGSLPLFRHTIVSYFGVIFIILGLVSKVTITNPKLQNYFFKGHSAQALIFSLWFLASGWFTFGIALSKEPISALVDDSQWAAMSQSIEQKIYPLCVPVNPIPWTYPSGCGFLNFTYDWKFGIRKISSPLWFDYTPPSKLLNNTLLGIAFLVKPDSSQESFIFATAEIKLKDGSTFIYSGGRAIKPSGGLLLLSGNKQIPIGSIISVKVTFNAPVNLAMIEKDSPEQPTAMLMGY